MLSGELSVSIFPGIGLHFLVAFEFVFFCGFRGNIRMASMHACTCMLVANRIFLRCAAKITMPIATENVNRALPDGFAGCEENEGEGQVEDGFR